MRTRLPVQGGASEFGERREEIDIRGEAVRVVGRERARPPPKRNGAGDAAGAGEGEAGGLAVTVAMSDNRLRSVVVTASTAWVVLTASPRLFGATAEIRVEGHDRWRGRGWRQDSRGSIDGLDFDPTDRHVNGRRRRLRPLAWKLRGDAPLGMSHWPAVVDRGVERSLVRRLGELYG